MAGISFVNRCLTYLFGLILYIPVDNSVGVFLGFTSTKQRINSLAQGHNTVPSMAQTGGTALCF